jgi:hypothetical protein
MGAAITEDAIIVNAIVAPINETKLCLVRIITPPHGKPFIVVIIHRKPFASFMLLMFYRFALLFHIPCQKHNI